MNPRVSILVPLFNQLPYTKQCVAALRRNTTGVPYELILVDNGSTDGTSEWIAAEAAGDPRIRTITFESNRGFTEATNAAARASKGDVLVLLNNDTLPRPAWLEPLLTELEAPGVGITGSRLVFPANYSINHAGYAYRKAFGGFYPIYLGFDADHPAVNKPRDYLALLGACVAVPRPLFESVGMLSDFGLEDIDLCFKVRRAGRRVRYVPSSFVYHYGSTTLKGSAPGTIPAADVHGFNERWSSREIADDDVPHYTEDGFKAVFETNAVILTHATDRGFNLLTEAHAALARNDSAAAAPSLLQAARIPEHPPGVLYWLAVIALGENRFVDACAFFRPLLTRRPRYFEVYPIAIGAAAVASDRAFLRELDERIRSTADIPFPHDNEIEKAFTLARNAGLLG